METMILVKDMMGFVIKMVVILLLIVMEIKITGVKVLDLLLIPKPKKLLSLPNSLPMMVLIMEIWSKLDGFTGWYYLPTYDSFFLLTCVFEISSLFTFVFCLQFAEPMVKNSKIPKLLLIPLLVWILSLMNFVKKVKKKN